MAIKASSKTEAGPGTKKRPTHRGRRKKRTSSQQDGSTDTQAPAVAPGAAQPSEAPSASDPPRKKRTSARRAKRKKTAVRATPDRVGTGERTVGAESDTSGPSAVRAGGPAPVDAEAVAHAPPAAPREPAGAGESRSKRRSSRRRRRKGSRPEEKAGVVAEPGRTEPAATPAVGAPDRATPSETERQEPTQRSSISELVVAAEAVAASPAPPAEAEVAAEPAGTTPATRQKKRKRSARRAKKATEKATGERQGDTSELSKPKMIINVTGEAECRIAILENGRLEELYIERQSAESHVGSIYKGRVTNVEPSIQAVFIDFGQPKNGFLHISDVHPRYFPNGEDLSENVGKKIPRRDRPPIQRCFRRGQEVVVQVTKEGVGTKGPTLTTYLSIPGRFLVMMPGMSRLGVSRKIEDQTERRTMREALGQLPLPEGMGFILRTAGLGRTKRDLQRDLTYLSRLWKTISERLRKRSAPTEVYQESDLVIRTIRDVSISDLDRIIVDDEATGAKAREFLKIAMPRTQNMVDVYSDPEPIFHKYGIEEEIERINARHVPLELGGSLVIESTEAMVAIDVNSGKFRTVEDAEESAFQINVQAAEEIARQLRLRDLGGLIVCDFIDMRSERHKREVERCLRNALKKHKERARILRMSQFGLIEMTRQRQRPSIKRSIYIECPHCRGTGMVKSGETMALEVMRVLQLAAHQKSVSRIVATVALDIATVLLNEKRARLRELEIKTGTMITVRGSAHLGVDQLECTCEDEQGRSVPTPA
ncbi:MAG TPA: Rne/Rng family ribonuclease [Phycisphaerae bacterium]|nr:Rne/Rng family ribonuclease [Phycisphaerae bacterium]